MSDEVRPEWANEQTERYITIGFVFVGAILLLVAFASTISQWDAVVTAWDSPGERAPSRAVMHAINVEILTAFIGAVLFSSGMLRLFE